MIIHELLNQVHRLVARYATHMSQYPNKLILGRTEFAILGQAMANGYFGPVEESSVSAGNIWYAQMKVIAADVETMVAVGTVMEA